MSLAARRIIFYSLILMFIIVAPLLISYSAGYRYSLKQRRMVKTGALLITTLPQGAAIFLDNQDQDKKTPGLITYLLPANYNITLQLEGYYPWQKSLSVYSEQTTFINNAPLFKKTEPQLVDKISASSVALSPADFVEPKKFNNYIITYEKKSDRVIVIDETQMRRIAEINQARGIWQTKDESALVIFSAHEVWYINPGKKENALVTRTTDEITGLFPTINTNAIVMIANNHVWGMELDMRDKQNVWDLASFDKIKNSTLLKNGKKIAIDGIYQGKEGFWEIEL